MVKDIAGRGLSIMKLDLMVFFSRNSLPNINNGAHAKNLNDKKVKEHIEFYYLLKKMGLFALVFLVLNIFHKKY